MNEIFDDISLALTDLMQRGLATTDEGTAKGFAALSERCGNAGLHTGAALCAELARLLGDRMGQIEKSDLQITAALCRTEHYIALCRHRMTQEDIRRRWDQGGNP